MRYNEDRIGALIWYEMIEHDISRIPSHIHIQTRFMRVYPLAVQKLWKAAIRWWEEFKKR